MRNYIPASVFSREGELDLCFDLDAYISDLRDKSRAERDLREAEADGEKTAAKALRKELQRLEARLATPWTYLRITGLKRVFTTSSDPSRTTWFVWHRGCLRRIDLRRALHLRLLNVKRTLEDLGIPMQGFASTYSLREKILQEGIAYTSQYAPFPLEHFRRQGVCPIFLRNGKTILVSPDEIREVSTSLRFRNLWALPMAPTPGETTNFEKFVKERIGKDCVEFVYQVIGWCMSPVALVEPAFVFLQGDGGSGKSTLIRVIRHIVGQDNTSALPLEEINNRSAERLAFSLVNASTENKAGRIDEEILKALASQEQRTVDPKYRDPYDIVPVAKLIFALNNLPPVTDLTEGFWRRCIVIPFSPVPKEERDPRYFEKYILPETPHIAYKAILALQKLLRLRRFILPRTIARATARYQEENSSIAFFVEDLAEMGEQFPFLPLNDYACTIDGEPGYFIPRQDLHRAFQAWAQAAGYNRLSSRVFYRRLELYQDIFIPHKRDGRRGYFVPLSSLAAQNKSALSALTPTASSDTPLPESLENQGGKQKEEGSGHLGHLGQVFSKNVRKNFDEVRTEKVLEKSALSALPALNSQEEDARVCGTCRYFGVTFPGQGLCGRLEILGAVPAAKEACRHYRPARRARG
ncbi:MAG TPA: hypothetical protein ENJ40_07965 [Thermosulfurimonas dismutans]|uniref:SF3 helicase domain-containing protein n=1 Tax=Thermosulfurimonas dismutans TaxID=999894 RepID=A0A7C3CM31_9BACT|nr:hypothetical protein [Thermosulfurimonas dismutans]